MLSPDDPGDDGVELLRALLASSSGSTPHARSTSRFAGAVDVRHTAAT